ncbi:MAG TPA: hypothetical protein VKH35_15630 [Thermoanaerobaculia bacterium]|nr:hypothetical protein [Thermoanaerobaculia bacterium]
MGRDLPARAHLALLILVGLTVCRTQSLPTRGVAAISPDAGAVSAKLIADPNAPGVQLGAGEEFVRAVLSANVSPAYPEELIALHLPRTLIAVRVTFDEAGKFLRIDDSPLAQSTAGRYTPSFRGAVERAVTQWRCRPPRIRKFRPGPDADGDGKSDYGIMVGEKLFKTFFDVSFSFEIVGGMPAVKPES